MNKLTDQYGRRHEYLRISVTDRCNLRCRYCMPSGEILATRGDTILSFEEITGIARIFVDLGIRKIRITGGEPLVRRGIETLCADLAAIPGLETLALSTNGVLLEEKAESLKNAGVQQVNISLDTLRPDRFGHITLRTSHNAVLSGIRKALQTGFSSVKINMVVMKGFNDDELLDFVEFAIATGLNIRFIEYMPFVGNGWSEGNLMSFAEMRRMVASRYELRPLNQNAAVPGPAKEFRVAGTDAAVGFITTMTDHFCGSCNRLRVMADGRMLSCLFEQGGVDLRCLVRSGAERSVIEESIRASVLLKWERHPDTEELRTEHTRKMIGIGG